MISNLRSSQKDQDQCQDRSGSEIRSDQIAFDPRSEDHKNIGFFKVLCLNGILYENRRRRRRRRRLRRRRCRPKILD